MFSIFKKAYESLSPQYSQIKYDPLTGLSIVIGILTVTLMGTLISGLDKGFDKSMDFLGKDVLSISRWEWFGGQEWWEVRNGQELSLSTWTRFNQNQNMQKL